MRTGSRFTLVYGALVLLALAGPAHAQNKAAADAAFNKGKELMAAGKTAEACVEFERSQKLDPQFGAQYNLALCYQAIGKLASACAEFDELASKDSNARRREQSKVYADGLRPRLTRLRLIVHDPVPGLVVLRDGKDITLLAGVTTPVDPGKSTFAASAPGRKTWSQPVDLTAEGATITVDIPRLEFLPEQKPEHNDKRVVPPAGDNQASVPGVTDSATTTPGRGRALGRLGIVIAGTGLAATATGLVFGFLAKSATDDARSTCNGKLDPCTGDVLGAQDEIDRARSRALIANVSVGVGVAAIAAGVVLWVTAPDDASPENRTVLVPVIGEDRGGLVLEGRF